jgi:hypothetical protein
MRRCQTDKQPRDHSHAPSWEPVRKQQHQKHRCHGVTARSEPLWNQSQNKQHQRPPPRPRKDRPLLEDDLNHNARTAFSSRSPTQAEHRHHEPDRETRTLHDRCARRLPIPDQSCGIQKHWDKPRATLCAGRLTKSHNGHHASYRAPCCLQTNRQMQRRRCQRRAHDEPRDIP